MAAKRASRLQTSVVSDSTAMLPMISWSREIGRTTRRWLPSNRTQRFDARRRDALLEGGVPEEIRPHVGREQRAVAREQSGVEDVLVGGRGPQRLGRRRGILERQRRGAVGADDVGEHRDVADQAGPAVDVVVGREDRARRDQRHPAGGQGGRRQLAPDRLAAEPGAEAIEHDRPG